MNQTKTVDEVAAEAYENMELYWANCHAHLEADGIVKSNGQGGYIILDRRRYWRAMWGDAEDYITCSSDEDGEEDLNLSPAQQNRLKNEGY